ncbi:MAG: hypothetical protein CMB80_29360 [Flammeovirgaceae bacterium]|nr:hypothetical protein [Flammeovirgaceae bacterium]MBE63104.1 hypothetical protein [Flammeovirgaceae bacterium]MBR09233.1 hypothetical protein [Rickettsiales bacterium]|tara:strand:- start:180 stop:662 length:483 start_codon:yes stop_codon:yes gene_type:complete
MDKLYIICVDDQREVLNALTEDLEVFEKYLKIEECESVNEALDVMEEVDTEGNYVSLLITDQVMPNNTGVDLLKKLSEDSRFGSTKTILLTGQATHKDTIEAINSAHLNHYVEKPWKKDELHAVIKTLVTQYLLDKGLDYQPYMDILDQTILYNNLRKTT